MHVKSLVQVQNGIVRIIFKMKIYTIKYELLCQ